jgi:hypothetical protein
MRRVEDRRLNERLERLGYRPSRRPRRWLQMERTPGEPISGRLLVRWPASYSPEVRETLRVSAR